jgi:5'-phosphate synthase pdxT subunit
MAAERIPGEATAAGRVAPPEVAAPPEGARTIGVLALQGDVLEHVRMLRAAGAKAAVVKRLGELDAVDGIVIPGGESTTIGKLAQMYGLLEPLRKRIAEGLPVFGTCAGAILLSSEALFADGRPAQQPLLGVLDATVRRNAFGRQVASFEGDVAVAGLDNPVHAVFIRAPWFERVGPDVEVLATVGTPAGDKVVIVRSGVILATAFHPELTGDPRLHELFIAMVGRAAAQDPVVTSQTGVPSSGGLGVRSQ